MSCDPFTGQGSLDYITQKRVPMIGGSGGEPWAYDSPMYFPQASSGDYFIKLLPAAVARRVLPEGKKKLGTAICAEGAPCEKFDRIWGETAPQKGFQQVYRTRISGAQPDFTAECLAARNAGAEVMFVMHVPNTVGNFVNSCLRQGFRPVWAFPGQALAPLTETESFDGAFPP